MAFFASKALLVGVFGAIFYLYGVDSKATIHTVFTTECGEYFSWQSMGKIAFGLLTVTKIMLS